MLKFYNKFLALTISSVIIFLNFFPVKATSSSDSEAESSSSSGFSSMNQQENPAEQGVGENQQVEVFVAAIPEEVPEVARHIVGRFLSCFCSHMPNCTKKVLRSGIYVFKFSLELIGRAATYASAGQLLAHFFIEDKEKYFALGGAVIAVLETGSDIAKKLLKADHKIELLQENHQMTEA